MKVLLYFEKPETIKTSGIGRAMRHQIAALKSAGVDFTLDPNDSFDLAHINTYWPDSKKLVKKLLKRNVPIVVHGHSTIEDFRNSFTCWPLVAKVWYNPNLMWFYSRADHIITPTNYSKRLIESYNLGTKVSYVSNGIDPNEYALDEEKIKAFKDKFNITNEKVVMGVGFPFNRKGLKDFFAIAKERPNIKFIWFGYLKPILQTRDIRKAIRHKPSNVIMPGYIDNSIIKGCYRYAECMLFPTYEETEGIVVLEALASSCPVLVRDIGVYEDWLSDGKNCYKAKNNKEFLDKLDYLMSHDNSKITKEGYKVVSDLSFDKIGKELKETYKKVIEDFKKNN